MNNGFIESTISTPIALPSNNSVIAFQNDSRTRSTLGCNSWLCHKEGSPIYKIVKCGNYEVNFSASVFSATAGTVALALFEDGVLIPDTVRTVTLSAGYLGTIAFDKIIKVCCKANSTISVGAVANIINPSTGETVTTVTPTISSATFSIKA